MYRLNYSFAFVILVIGWSKSLSLYSYFNKLDFYRKDYKFNPELVVAFKIKEFGQNNKLNPTISYKWDN